MYRIEYLTAQTRVPYLALAPVPMGVHLVLVGASLAVLAALVVVKVAAEIIVEVALGAAVALVHLKRRELWMK